ncbi:XkdQ/YqbQ family protein [Clostridium butyricum]|uniref:XkdQ/YqbQ family protein n=1 Tax=Clostridium butyricum TaxID=1492 RepID=UPI002ABDD812|nr:hypothetical protein [Clostridium butyricum]
MYKLITQDFDLMPYSNTVSWSDDIDTLGTQLQFESTIDIGMGSVVSKWINGKEDFRGIVKGKSEKRWTFSYTCLDYSFYLKNKVVKQFNNDTASNAINSLLNESYIKSDIVPIPTKINKIYKTSIADIIDDILDQAQQDQGVKYFKELNGNILTIKKVEEMRIAPKIILPKDIDINSSIEEMKNKIIITSNSEDNAAILATAEDSSEQWWYGVLSDISSVDDKNISQAQNIANNLLKEKNKIFKNTSFEVEGVFEAETIKANRMIYLNIGKRLNGFYKIKSSNHTLKGGSHKVNISLEW